MTDTRPAGAILFALAVYLTVALLAGIVAFTATAGVIDSMPVAWIVALAAAGAAGWRSATHQPFVANLSSVPRPFRVAFVTGAALCLVQLAPLTAFIIDPNVAAWPAGPWRPWQSRHSCVSCYWVAAEKATVVPDLYFEPVYRPPIPPNAARRPNLGPFFVDVFEYPPTFLPLPRLLAAATPDFWGFRRLWFALNLAGVVLGLVLIARRVDTACGTSTVWLTPWVLVAPSVVGTLQAGNVQLLFIVQSAAAMLLFERRRHALGGVLLGYAIASKLYPGVLVLHLLLRRDWRAVGWTAAAGLAIVLVTLADVGWTPFAAFLDHLPKILSGEAFPGLSRPEALSINQSIPGLVFKLGLFGLPNADFAAARVVGWIYTGVLVAATVWLARRPSDRGLDPLIWIAVLILATLRSPFLPGYGAFPSLWLAALIAGVAWRRPPLRTAAIVSGGVLAFSLGQGFATPPVNAIQTFTQTVAALLVVFGLLPRAAGAPAAAAVAETAAPLPA
jgi:hypothetical protein